MFGTVNANDFHCEGFVPVGAVGGIEGASVRIRTTGGSLDLIRSHIARLEERALQAEANLRHVEGERRLWEKDVARLKESLAASDLRIHVAERDAHDANEIVRSLRADEFSCETVVPIGDVEGSGNVWVRLRSTQDGVGMLVMQLCRLDQRAVLAEAALEAANARASASEARADRADATARDLCRMEFEWEDTIPVEEPGGDRVLVRVRGTEGGIGKIRAEIARKEGQVRWLTESLYSAKDRADAAGDKLAAIQSDAAEVAAARSEAIVERNAANARADAAEIRLQVAEGKLEAIENSVKSYADFTKAFDRLRALGVRPVVGPTVKVGPQTNIFPRSRRVDPLSEVEAFRRAVRTGV